MKEFTFFILFSRLCNGAPGRGWRQEIWADLMSHHHDDLMVSLGGNRKKMGTEIWVQNCVVKM